MEINKHDIVVLDNNDIVQYISEYHDNGILVQDIHTKIEITHTDFVKRKATKDEIKWFCEHTEHINFIQP